MGSGLMSSAGLAGGGPLGGIVGSIFGSATDSAFRRSGAALTSAPGAVQSSDYGVGIPRLFGIVRTRGLMVWATPMRRAGGGKAGGRRAYVMSFAVAVSSRKVERIGRIWADGREIRDRNGRFETPTTMRLRSAMGSTGPDSLLEIVAGRDQSPDYRGMSLLLFEDFALAPFGNRIPLLEFEVHADDGTSHAGSWLAELGGLDAAVDRPDHLIGGMSALDSRTGADIERLEFAAGTVRTNQAGHVGWGGAGESLVIPADEILEAAGDSGVGHSLSFDEQPDGISISYSDISRDFQVSQQTVAGDRRAVNTYLALPMALQANTVRKIARKALSDRLADCERLQLQLAWKYAGLGVGQLIRLGEDERLWEIDRLQFENMLVRIECRRRWATGTHCMPGDGGGSIAAPLPPSPLAIFSTHEPPVSIDGRERGPGFWLSATASEHWRGVSVATERSGSLVWLGEIREAAVGGSLVEPLAEGATTIWDLRNAIFVQLDDPDGWIESRDHDAVLAGANLAFVGAEILQFARVEAMGGGLFKLSGLLRNCLGTKAPPGGHDTGARFGIVDQARMMFVEGTMDELGFEKRLTLVGEGGAEEGETLAVRLDGTSVGPLPVCHVTHRRTSGGELQISWVPRDRAHWSWNADGPVIAQRYRVSIVVNATVAIELITDGDSCLIDAWGMVEDAIGDDFAVSVLIEVLGPGSKAARTVLHPLTK